MKVMRRILSSRSEKSRSLVGIIKSSPDATLVVDNDRWHIERFDTSEGQWVIVADSDEFGGNVYGFGVLTALAELVGLNVDRA